MQIRLISNPNSGHNRKNPKHIEKLSQILGERVQLPNLKELDSTIMQYKQDELDILAIAGGDGTIHQVLSAVYRVYKDEKWPYIALLSSGTMNNVARNVGVKKKPLAQLQSIMEKIHNHIPLTTSVRRPLLFNEDKAGFIFGQGGIPHVLEEYEKGGNTSKTKAVTVLTRTIFSALFNGTFAQRLFAPIDMDVLAEGKKQHHSRYTVSILSCIPDIGFGFRPCYETIEKQNIAQFIGCTRHPIFTAFYLPKFRLALPIKNSFVQDSVAQSFTLIPKKEMMYTIDGDLYMCTGELNIRLGSPITFVL